MARTAIHLCEHLVEELRELRVSAAELSRQLAEPCLGVLKEPAARRTRRFWRSFSILVMRTSFICKD
ncbi:MAG: hypothetical protein ACREDA_09805, partial [Methylocella sp.]